MRRRPFGLFLISVAGLTAAVCWAYCSSSTPVYQASQGTLAVNPASTNGVYFQLGQIDNDHVNPTGGGAGVDNGGQQPFTSTPPWINTYQGTYSLNADFAQPFNDGCPNNNPVGVVIWDTSTSSPLQVIIATAPIEGTAYNFDDSTYINGANTGGSNYTYHATPAPTVTAHTSAGVYTLGLPALTNALYYYNGTLGDPGPAAIFAGYRVYFLQQNPSPTTYAVSSWTPATIITPTADANGFVNGTTSQTITLSGPTISSTNVYFAIVPTFVSASTALSSFHPPILGSWVGPVAGPTPAGVFAGFDAKLAMGTVTATWRSNAESGLAFYQVYTSKLVGGPYVPINGTLTSPMGDSHVYTATFPFPKEIGKRKVFLKVKATDTDGTEWWTQPVKVARRTAP